MQKTLWRLGALSLALSAALLAGGCASTDSGGTTTLKRTQMNVDWPMNRFRNEVAFGRITLGEEQQVNQAYAAFKSAFDAALKAANTDLNAPTPANVGELANQVLQAIAAAEM